MLVEFADPAIRIAVSNFNADHPENLKGIIMYSIPTTISEEYRSFISSWLDRKESDIINLVYALFYYFIVIIII